MRRSLVAAAALVMVTTACGQDSAARVLRVDFRNDDFASHYWRFFPDTMYAHPGDELIFNQEWTGEPHTVTFGTLVDQAVPRIQVVEAKYADAEPTTEEAVAQATAEYESAIGDLPLFDPYLDSANPAAMQPCYLNAGAPPKAKACIQRAQPKFTGRQAYYSSGFIPPTGSRGNRFRLRLAEEISPGTFRFYCVIHFPDMQGTLVVKPSDEKLPTQEEANDKARAQIDALAKPLRQALAQARAGNAIDPRGDRIELPLAGYHSADQFTVAADEFVPRRFETRANEPVTWTISGAHTVSFGVPEFVPIYRVRPDGTVRRNATVDRAAGGSPQPPPVDFTQGPVEIDGGTWDGRGFISSGLLGSEPVSRYTLRFSKPGTYEYACLVHPAMVATLVVRR